MRGNKYVDILMYNSDTPANTTHRAGSSKATVQRLRYQPVSQPAPAQRLMFA